MPDATFTRPDLTTFTRLDGLGLEVTGQLLEPDRSVLACRVVEPDDWCRRCGCQGVPRDTVSREFAHEPFGWRPTTLVLTVRRYRCKECSHVWRHTRRGDKYVTVIIDLTPVRDGTGPSRLLDVVQGRSKKAFKDWLAERDQAWRDGIEVVAMDGFAGFKTATTEELPDAVTVMDPFHVIRLAGDALDECRRRVQQELHGHRGRKGDPLYTARRTLHTGADLLTDRQHERLDKLFAGDRHVHVECTWGIYQRMISAYRHPDRAAGRVEMNSVIDALADSVPEALVELRKLGRTLTRRACDVLAYFDRPRTSNGPTEAVNGRLEHLRGLALGFRNLTNYIARALLEAGGFRPHLHPEL
ncbi:ISL3 family transposase [Kocuria rhizophila]|uniref:ISL3 family transposase n=1 Tax=Kocuria rhizophila TaxID=72000 RepID=UPI0022F08A06|nr:ISL3 family transposase [Kocuria rhizophila]MDA4829860.1 ISL3 family transposase [Kocuria rhizophila]